MDDKDDRWLGLTIFDVILFGACIILVAGAPVFVIVDAIGSPAPEICGVALGSSAVLLIVRWMNHRNNPQNQKRPPDSP
jgi:hypothetical protein